MEDKVALCKMFAAQRRDALLAQVKQLARHMAQAATQIQTSADQADLARLVWLVRVYDPVLAAQLDAAHATDHFLGGL